MITLLLFDLKKLRKSRRPGSHSGLLANLHCILKFEVILIAKLESEVFYLPKRSFHHRLSIGLQK